MTHKPGIAVIGLGCRYPGAATLREFWENVVAQRQQFRRLPEERLPLADYHDPDPTAVDKTYATEAAVIDGFQFDWIGRSIPKPIFEAADIVHWLALEIALGALDDAGYGLADGLPKQRAGVILGNTLTGEHTRSTTLRARWPFVEKAFRAAGQARGLSPTLTAELAATTEQYFKSVFPPTSEDTLAGSLSNTIAGRICGYLGLGGGGYTVDGACSSSLIAVATAANALHSGTLDVALAGGVDVSLDTFELVGFAKTGALTKDDLHVYDRRAKGFKPGEGCGFVVLKRLEDARADGDYVYAVLRGWGISSDGKRAVTTPNAEGQARAIRRAYEHTDYTPRDLTFVEGHGTGTVVGDVVELTGISLAMQGDEEPRPRSCGVTSLKSVVGHTKAAAGVGGLIKAVLAANRRVLPPTAGCTEPNPVFDDQALPLYPILNGQVRPASETFRVGVSAAGFGGINCHVTLESADAPAAHLAPPVDERALLVSNQQTELFLCGAGSVEELVERVDAVQHLADGISYAELADLAKRLVEELDPESPIRTAVVAGKPGELLDKLVNLEDMLRAHPPQEGKITSSPDQAIWIGNRVGRARLGLMFPGQGSQQLNMARTLVERYDWARRLVDRAAEWLRPYHLEGIRELIYRPLHRAENDAKRDAWVDQLKQTEVAQPAICLASLLWCKYLERLGIEPVAVGGHSLGELMAFYAAGAYDEPTLLKLAVLRGKAMAAGGKDAGTMASLACNAAAATELLDAVAGNVVIANLNSPSQTVVSGEPAAVKAVVERAQGAGVRATVLPVSNAFHSGYVADAARQVRNEAAVPETLGSMAVNLFTSTDGSRVCEGLALADHFAEQIVAHVDFVAMVEAMSNECDLFAEVGPGQVLSGLVGSICGGDGPICLPVESKSGRDRDLHVLLGCLFARGGTARFAQLYEQRLVRPFVPAAERIFIDNPCERLGKIDGVELPPPQSTGAALKTVLAQSAGLSPQAMGEYLTRRGQFLGAVVRADVESSAGSLDGMLPPAHAADARCVEAEASEPKPEPDEKPASTVPEVLLEEIEKLTGFPPKSVSLDMRLIDDLNLDSIKAAELIASVAKRIGVAGDIDPGQFGNATLEEIADMLAASAGSDGSSPARRAAQAHPTWVRNFVVEHVEEPAKNDGDFGDWRGDRVLILAEADENDVVQALRDRLAGAGAKVACKAFGAAPSEGPVEGEPTRLVAVLPRGRRTEGASDERLRRIIHRLRSIAAPARSKDRSRPATVAYVQFGGGRFGDDSPSADVEQLGAKALAASLHLERGDLRVRALDFAPDADVATLADKVACELATEDGFAAVGYDAHFTRRVPKLGPSEPATYAGRRITWSGDDVILVTGGAKGITAECALAVAEKTGVKMALVGSSRCASEEEEDEKGSEILRTLERFADNGLVARYFQCDVADAEAVAALVEQVEAQLGPITGVVHGAAVNKPRLLKEVGTDEAFREVAPKVLGAENLCRALADRAPKLFVGLSSIIGVSGMWRNGWYGFSNETMNQILGRFEAEHPETAVVCPAYSVWDEVGMGVRMGSTDYLASKGIGAIPAEEGVRRFVQLFEADAGCRQVVITARVAGLDSTLKPVATPTMPRSRRFLEEVTYVYPGVELVCRVHLSVERDTYLNDHNWNGSLLFPTVFGLEAMSQMTAYVTGREDFQNVRIEDVRLQRPIVVNPEKGLDVELRAEVLERTSADEPRRVKVGITTEMSDFARDHFSAEFVLDEAAKPPLMPFELPERPLAIDPKRDLYGWLLFQGESYQRLRQVHTLDSNRCVFSSEIALPDTDEEPSGDGIGSLMGDAYFRDSLLQSVQMLVPRKIALPVHIDRVQRYPYEGPRSALLTGLAFNHGEEEGKQTFSVYAVDANGRVVERLEGYVLGIVEQKPDNPTAEELADPTERDERMIREAVNQRAEAFEIEAPEVAMAHMPGLHELSKEDRHKRELPVLEKTVAAVIGNGERLEGEQRIGWLESGKPAVEGEGTEQVDVSLSHDDQTLLCTVGRGPQGCDVHAVKPRGREDWVALLSKARSPLLDKLLQSGDTLDRAGTRIWSALEAVRKATAAAEVDLKIRRRLDESVLFGGRVGGVEFPVLTFPEKLTVGPEKIFAVVSQASEAPPEPQPVPGATEPVATTVGPATAEKLAAAIPALEEAAAMMLEMGYDPTHHVTGGGYGPNGKPFMMTRAPLCFRDNRMLSGGIYFSNYYAWMGKLRELALSPILGRLADDMVSGEWGMVTNSANVRVLGDAGGSGVVETRAWIEKVHGRDNSTIELRFDWNKVLPDGSTEPIAIGQMQTTWVRVLGHGQVEIAPFPAYVQEFLKTMVGPQGGTVEEVRDAAADLELGEELYCTSRGPKAGKVLDEQTFQTSLEDANLVGNIYFDNYSKWQGRLRDVYFFEAAPHLYRPGAADGELMCRNSRIQHIREAMPFDRIHVSMGLRAVYEHGVKLEFEYSRIDPDGTREKLAFSEHEAVWTVRDAEGRPTAAPLPAELRDSLSIEPLAAGPVGGQAWAADSVSTTAS